MDQKEIDNDTYWKIVDFYDDTKETVRISRFNLHLKTSEILSEKSFFDNHKKLFSDIYNQEQITELEQWLDLLYKQSYYQENKAEIRKVAKKYIRNSQIRKDVLAKCNNTCVHCGTKRNLQIDHIIPLSKGGLNQLDNLQILCRTCNLKKGNKVK